MTFYLEPGIKTSDALDYANNIYDKGHLAPAATFSDNMTNLTQTFTYLNCALQNQYLNRGEWRLLEEQERVWDDKEPLTVIIEILFDNTSERLKTGATVPSRFKKHIYFEQSRTWKCYQFTNARPTISWKNSAITCDQHK